VKDDTIPAKLPANADQLSPQESTIWSSQKLTTYQCKCLDDYGFAVQGSNFQKPITFSNKRFKNDPLLIFSFVESRPVQCAFNSSFPQSSWIEQDPSTLKPETCNLHHAPYSPKPKIYNLHPAHQALHLLPTPSKLYTLRILHPQNTTHLKP